MAREIQDHWFKEAKRQGFRSRAAFKLIEIDDKRRILTKGRRVLDLGCAPGSWTQVAAQRTAPNGIVVGIDLQVVTGSFRGSPVHLLQGDAAELSDETLEELGLDPSSPFDVLLSDMAPSTTGSRDTDHYGSMRLCNLVLDLAAMRLSSGGDLIMKMFEGPGSKDLLERARSMFETVRPAKPKASRSVSREMFIVCLKRSKSIAVDHIRDELAGGPPPLTGGWGS